MDIKKDHINFAVGPVQISEEISRIGADPVPYFRTPDFSALMKENEALLKEFMDAPEDARAVFLTGSGTASMDAVTQNVFTKDDRLLVVAGGSFGHRFCEICEVYGIPHTAIELRQGHALTPADLAPYAGQGYTGLLVNMHETSTGVLYDMDMISAFCRENGLVLVVDAISAFLADDVSMKRWGADVVFTDVWASMGQEEEKAIREKAFAGYQINRELMAETNPGCMVQHCLPAHRGEEITADVFEEHAEEIFDEAENRLHVQKAVLAVLLAGK